MTAAKKKYQDPRSSASRREYFRAYHEGRRLAGRINRQVPKHVRHDRAPGVTVADMRAAWLKRAAYLEEVGGQWPERRAEHPESIEQTLRRIK